MKYGLLALTLSLLLGYGPAWSGYYVAWLLGEDQIQVLGDLTKYEVPCKSVDTPLSRCTNAYLIPVSEYSRWGDEAAVGAGRIISATRYHCVESEGNEFVVDDPMNPGRTFETFTTYQTVSLGALRCKSGLVIEAWSKKGAVRKGYLGGTAVTGRNTAVERVKRLSEFFSMHLLFGLTIVFTILQILSRTLRKYVDSDSPVHPYEAMLPFWLINTLLISGILQTIFALIQVPQLFNRISMFLTHFNYIAVPIAFLTEGLVSKKHKKLSFLVIGSILVCFAASSKFAVFFQPLNIAILVFFTGGILFKRQYDCLFMSLCFLLTVLKIQGFDYLPAEYLVYPFYAFAVSFILLSKIRLNARMAALAQWAQSNKWRNSNADLLEVLLEKVHSEIGAGRTTLLSVSREGQVKIQIKIANEPVQTFIRQELPPLFAHVFSVGEPVMHLKADSEKYRHISRGATPKGPYSTGIFSILPIKSESRMIGAIAFAEYSEDWAESHHHTFLMKYLTQTLEASVVEQIHANDWKNRGEWSKMLLEAQSHLPSAKSLNEAHIILCRSLKCFGFLASLDHFSRLFTLHAIDGYPTEVDERLRNGRIYALRENEQGPIAIAANQQRTVIIPDVKLLWGVLHENSKIFFERSGTQSCAGVPIFKGLKGSSNRELWGVLFLERGLGEPFTLEARAALEQIANEFTELLDRFEQEKVTNDALKMLSTLVPPRLLERVISEGMQREDDFGTFVMLDLKDSTKIATHVGSENWLKTARSLAGPLEELAIKHGLSWHYFNWDAFYFTRSSKCPNEEDLDRVLSFFDEAYSIIQKFYVTNFSDYGEYSGASSRVARLCITHGDISRGFQDGATRVWTMVGSEMSAMTKLEDLCKRIDGTVFCDETMAPALDSNWHDTKQKVPSTGRAIFCHEQKRAGLNSISGSRHKVA